MRSSESPDGGEGVGAVRQFNKGFTASIEEIERLDPPTVFGYTLLESKALHIREYHAEVTLTPNSEGTTITWEGSFRPLFPGSGWLWQRMLNRFYNQFAEGLAEYAAELEPPTT